jgi:hypothetical protein
MSPATYVQYFHISTSRSMCAELNMAYLCSSLISCSSGTLLRYCLSDFEMVPVAPYYYWFIIIIIVVVGPVAQSL